MKDKERLKYSSVGYVSDVCLCVHVYVCVCVCMCVALCLCCVHVCLCMYGCVCACVFSACVRGMCANCFLITLAMVHVDAGVKGNCQDPSLHPRCRSDQSPSPS